MSENRFLQKKQNSVYVPDRSCVDVLVYIHEIKCVRVKMTTNGFERTLPVSNGDDGENFADFLFG